ncbi:MAG: (E)-4-hydroxy-3-methylbut-2-enyl-diphosphate synthase [Leptospiraceae bacterium]|nr:(E)-4-hydroxy-3-methylbut-2-enyl-diphosphate synthase [Leptospiraceae bacterium]MDW7975007.1 (E)-4-hydroxy-3-methylbut-2-enyl-diphosphate synthase [Leptospiraceae bacterium]
MKNTSLIDINSHIKEIVLSSKNINYQGKYFDHPFVYQRFPTRKVRVGKVYLGGDEPIRVQSMTTTPTLDIEATVFQTKKLFEAGCEIVRITTKNPKEAKALKEIKEKLLQDGYDGPIVADVHFSPQTALIAADYADKVRINPGNFVDTKTFEKKEYTDEEYEKEIEKIHHAFKPLILKLKEQGKSLRIGCNHGSLSDRIMNRFGDTPEGMVESVIEYIKIAEYYDFHEIVVSMKASNPFIMIQAYKMLIERFLKESMNYPIHLGVTEAGDGKDGRLKSAAGIGLLLLEGIGDTIRVSLTEDPIEEIPVAKAIIQSVENIKKQNQLLYETLKDYPNLSIHQPYEIKRTSKNYEIPQIGSQYQVKWAINFHSTELNEEFIKNLTLNPPDYFILKKEEFENYKNFINNFNFNLKITPIFEVSVHDKDYIKKIIAEFEECGFYLKDFSFDDHFEIFSLFEKKHILILNVLFRDFPSLDVIRRTFMHVQSISERYSVVISFESSFEIDLIRWYRFLRTELREPPPVLLKLNITKYRNLSEDDLIAYIGILGAGSIYSSIGDILWVESDRMEDSFVFGTDVLQITRLRLSRADFISCPSCGRTLFDLQITTQRIKELTQHLKGVKIAIMGCIVNGLGEMADADFGYVGASPGKVNLYRGKELIKRNVPEEEAPLELVRLIQESGKWIDPS